MKVSDAFPSKYLKAADVERPYVLTIKRVALEAINPDDPDEFKPVLYFETAQKGLVLNVTNANMVASMYGQEMDDWAGHEVEVFTIWTEYRGAAVMGLRLRPPHGAKAATVSVTPPQLVPVVEAPATEDDIPF